MSKLKNWLLNYQHYVVRTTTVIGCVALGILVVLIIQSGFFNDPEHVRLWIAQFGSIAPLIFLFISILQVVIPVMPGNVSTVVGVMLFDIGLGSILNIVGIFIGSLLNFVLARKYGRGFASYFVKDKTYEKYMGWMNQGTRFERFFVIALVFPGFPDDFICLIAGLTKMTVGRFVFYFLLCKPITLFIYTLVALYGLNYFYDVLQSFF